MDFLFTTLPRLFQHAGAVAHLGCHMIAGTVAPESGTRLGLVSRVGFSNLFATNSRLSPIVFLLCCCLFLFRFFFSSLFLLDVLSAFLPFPFYPFFFFRPHTTTTVVSSPLTIWIYDTIRVSIPGVCFLNSLETTGCGLQQNQRYKDCSSNNNKK